MYYKRKTYEIEAIQFKQDNLGILNDWFKSENTQIRYTRNFIGMIIEIRILMKNKEVLVKENDYIIKKKGKKQDFYVLIESEFNKSYEKL